MPAKRIALIIHTGAGSKPKDLERTKRIGEKLRAICEKGYRFLQNHAAMETVTKVVQELEDWPQTNAGIGSMLQSDGRARLSASVMDGRLMKFSGVINIENIKNPILVAKLLQNERDQILAGDGALKFAKKHGFKTFNPRTKDSIEHWRTLLKHKQAGKYGTVGACALDSKGCLAAATSTGGRGIEFPGRVSDSALPAGNYANSFAAISATGFGEDIIDEALASTIALRSSDGNDLGQAFETTFYEARKRNRRFAAIGVDRKSNVFWNQTTEIFYYAFATPRRSGLFMI